MGEIGFTEFKTETWDSSDVANWGENDLAPDCPDCRTSAYVTMIDVVQTKNTCEIGATVPVWMCKSCKTKFAARSRNAQELLRRKNIPDGEDIADMTVRKLQTGNGIMSNTNYGNLGLSIDLDLDDTTMRSGNSIREEMIQVARNEIMATYDIKMNPVITDLLREIEDLKYFKEVTEKCQKDPLYYLRQSVANFSLLEDKDESHV